MHVPDRCWWRTTFCTFCLRGLRRRTTSYPDQSHTSYIDYYRRLSQTTLNSEIQSWTYNMSCTLVAHLTLRRNLRPHLLLAILLLLLQAWRGGCHPQCLDFKPPFEPRQPLVFCKEYSKFGCCDLEKDNEVSVRFYTVMDNFDHSGYVTCGKYIRSLLCQVREKETLIVGNTEGRLFGVHIPPTRNKINPFINKVNKSPSHWKENKKTRWCWAWCYTKAPFRRPFFCEYIHQFMWIPQTLLHLFISSGVPPKRSVGSK